MLSAGDSLAFSGALARGQVIRVAVISTVVAVRHSLVAACASCYYLIAPRLRTAFISGYTLGSGESNRRCHESQNYGNVAHYFGAS